MTKNKVTIKGKEIKLVEDPEFTIGIGIVLNNLLLALDESEPEWDVSKLRKGDKYHVLGTDGTPYEATWYGGDRDKYRFKVGNIYPTKEAAQKAYEEIVNKITITKLWK